MKKAILVMGVVLTSSLLFAGGARQRQQSGGGDELKNPLNQAEGAYSLPLVKEPVTITYLGTDVGAPAGASLNRDRALVLEEIAKATNIVVKPNVIPEVDYWELENIHFADPGSLEDIVRIWGAQDGSQLVKLYSDGVLIDMNPYIDRYAPNIKRFLDENPNIRTTLTLPNGALVAFPTGFNLSKYSSAHTLIRKDWLDKLGLSVPETPQQFRETLKQIIERDPNGNGRRDEKGVMGWDYSTARQLGTAFGLTLITGAGWGQDANGKAVCQWTTPAYRAFLEFMHGLYTDGTLDPAFDHEGDSAPEDAAYANNELAVLVRDWTSNIVNRLDPNNILKSAHPEAVYVPVVWKDIGYGVHDPKEQSAPFWSTMGISTNCKDPVTAIRLLDYAMLGEGSELNFYGIEDISYRVVDGVKVLIGNYWETTLPRGTVLGNIFPGINTEAREQSIFEAAFLKSDPQLLAFAKEQVERSLINVKEVFTPRIPTVEAAERVNRLNADFTTYRNEMYSKFVRGEIPINNTEWNNYVNQMNALGALEMARIFSGEY